MSRRSEQLSLALHDYVVAHGTQPGKILRDLAEERHMLHYCAAPGITPDEHGPQPGLSRAPGAISAQGRQGEPEILARGRTGHEVKAAAA